MPFGVSVRADQTFRCSHRRKQTLVDAFLETWRDCGVYDRQTLHVDTTGHHHCVQSVNICFQGFDQSIHHHHHHQDSSDQSTRSTDNKSDNRADGRAIKSIDRSPRVKKGNARDEEQKCWQKQWIINPTRRETRTGTRCGLNQEDKTCHAFARKWDLFSWTLQW